MMIGISFNTDSGTLVRYFSGYGKRDTIPETSTSTPHLWDFWNQFCHEDSNNQGKCTCVPQYTILQYSHNTITTILCRMHEGSGFVSIT